MRPRRDIENLHEKSQAVWQNLLSMIDHSFMHEIQQHGLNEMVRVTQSRIGLLYRVDKTNEAIRLKLVSTPGFESHLLYPEPATDLTKPGPWSACLAEHGPVVRNHQADFAVANSNVEPIQRDLTLPVYEGPGIVAVIAVCNRPLDYGPGEVALLQEFADYLWRVVVRKRLHDRMADDLK